MASNNRYLLDTQIFIWWMSENKSLKKEVKDLLADEKQEVLLSTVSVWEIVIKLKIKKLRLPKDWKVTLTESKFKILPVMLEHVYELEALALHHRDPFDRMLIAQARVEGCMLITKDPKIKRYPVKTL